MVKVVYKCISNFRIRLPRSFNEQKKIFLNLRKSVEKETIYYTNCLLTILNCWYFLNSCNLYSRRRMVVSISYLQILTDI